MISSFKREGEIAPQCPLKFPQTEAETTVVVKFKVNLMFKNIISTLLEIICSGRRHRRGPKLGLICHGGR